MSGDATVDGKVEEGLEARGLIEVEGDGLYDRYLLALGLLIAVIIAFAFSGDGNVGRLISVVIEGLTLLVILRSSRVHQRALRGGDASSSASPWRCLCSGGPARRAPSGRRGPASSWGPCSPSLGPPVIVRRLLSPPHHRPDDRRGRPVRLPARGASSSPTSSWIGRRHQRESVLRADQTTANGVDFVYFSFVTLATLGYGDFTPQRRPRADALGDRGDPRSAVPRERRRLARSPISVGPAPVAVPTRSRSRPPARRVPAVAAAARRRLTRPAGALSFRWNASTRHECYGG